MDDGELTTARPLDRLLATAWATSSGALAPRRAPAVMVTGGGPPPSSESAREAPARWVDSAR
jgi:hypothetical protein